MYTQEHLIQAIETLGYYQAPEFIKTMYGVEISKEMLDEALTISNGRYIDAYNDNELNKLENQSTEM
jgi:hypothetical protein